VDPVDAIIHSIPRGVLRSRLERLVLDVDAHRFATPELPRREGEHPTAAPIIQKGLALFKATLGEPLQAQRRRRVRAVAPAALRYFARAQDDLHGVAGRRRLVSLEHDVHASPEDAAFWY